MGRSGLFTTPNRNFASPETAPVLLRPAARAETGVRARSPSSGSRPDPRRSDASGRAIGTPCAAACADPADRADRRRRVWGTPRCCASSWLWASAPSASGDPGARRPCEPGGDPTARGGGRRPARRDRRPDGPEPRYRNVRALARHPDRRRLGQPARSRDRDGGQARRDGAAPGDLPGLFDHRLVDADWARIRDQHGRPGGADVSAGTISAAASRGPMSGTCIRQSSSRV